MLSLQCRLIFFFIDFMHCNLLTFNSIHYVLCHLMNDKRNQTQMQRHFHMPNKSVKSDPSSSMLHGMCKLLFYRRQFVSYLFMFGAIQWQITAVPIQNKKAREGEGRNVTERGDREKKMLVLRSHMWNIFLSAHQLSNRRREKSTGINLNNFFVGTYIFNK